MQWELPKCPLEIHGFWGLAGYYMKFVENFSSIAAPLTKLTQKIYKFNWTEAQQTALQHLKQACV